MVSGLALTGALTPLNICRQWWWWCGCPCTCFKQAKWVAMAKPMRTSCRGWQPQRAVGPLLAGSSLLLLLLLTTPPPLCRRRHQDMHNLLWDGLKGMGLKPFVEKDEFRLATVNTIK